MLASSELHSCLEDPSGCGISRCRERWAASTWNSTLRSRVSFSSARCSAAAGRDPSELGIAADADIDAGRVLIRSERPTAMLAEITARAVELGIELGGLSVKRPSLEDVFIGLGEAEDGAVA